MSQLSSLGRIGVSVLACLALAVTGQASNDDDDDTITVNTVNAVTINVMDLNISGEVMIETVVVPSEDLEFQGTYLWGASGIEVDGGAASLLVGDGEASLVVRDEAGENGIVVTNTETVISGGSRDPALVEAGGDAAIGSTSLTVGKDGVSFESSNADASLDMGGSGITGLAPGSALGDAVNVDQFEEAVGQLEDAIETGTAHADQGDAAEATRSDAYTDTEVAAEATRSDAHADQGDAAEATRSDAYTDTEVAAEAMRSDAHADAGDVAEAKRSDAYTDTEVAAEAMRSDAHADAGDVAEAKRSDAYADTQVAAEATRSDAHADQGDAAEATRSDAYTDTEVAAEATRSDAHADAGDVAEAARADAYTDAQVAVERSRVDLVTTAVQISPGNTSLRATDGLASEAPVTDAVVSVGTNSALMKVVSAQGESLVSVDASSAKVVMQDGTHVKGLVVGASDTAVSGGASDPVSMRIDDSGVTFSRIGADATAAEKNAAAGEPVPVHGIADGQLDTDAVNKGQLNAVASEVSDVASALSSELSSVEHDAYRGIAISNAMEVFLPDPGKTFRVNLGVGYFKKKAALGLTGSGMIAESTGLYLGVGSDTSFNEVGGKAGISFQW